MAGKSLKRIPAAPMQRYEAVPITDPAEIAELEVKLKRLQDAEELVRTPGSTRVSAIAAADLLKLAQQLSAQSRVELIAKLAAQLSVAERSELVKQLVAKSPVNRKAVQ